MSLAEHGLACSYGAAALGVMLMLAGCGLGAPTGPTIAHSPRFQAHDTASLLLPDYQKTLLGPRSGREARSWYDVQGMHGEVNLDAQAMARLNPASFGLYDYLTRHEGPVMVLVGGVGEENTAWTRRLPCYEGVPVVVLNYALDAYVGPENRYWWPPSNAWQSSLVPFDGIPGVGRYGDSVRYGSYLLDKTISKLEAAGAPTLLVFAHSKGSDIGGHAAYDPAWGLDRRHDSRLAAIYTFSMPFISPFSPKNWGFISRAPHWGGFFKSDEGKLVIANRDSDFATYGGWGSLDEHDYTHLVADSWVGPYPGTRGKSPPWTPSESFMGRLKAFAASPATCDQSPEVLSYDW